MLDSLAETEPRMIATGCLLAVLFAGSAIVWRQLFDRKRRGEPFLEMNNGPRTRWRSALELIVVYVALLLLVASLLPRLRPQPVEAPPLPDLFSVAMQAAVSIGLTVILSLALASDAESWSAIGIKRDHFREQFRVGAGGFLAAVLPMAVSIAVASPFRSVETRHSLLKLLSDSPDPLTVAVIAVTAAIAAPLSEELLYRVILQGWLTTLYPSTVTISAVAVLFSFVHGWRDGLALLPLAFILGYVFHRSHSYLSVVVIHALFNATMLALQLLNSRI